MRYSKLMLAAAVLGVFGTQMAGATPTAEEVAQLGKTLTPFGAIKAGNKEGTIPEWTGGLCKPPAGYKPLKTAPNGTPTGSPYADPFPDEKPIFKITAANMAQYADKLDEGNKEMLRRFPQTFYINVFPTHRTACYPNWMYENTIKRVMSPKIVSMNTVPSLDGAHAQIPFPIPKSGVEVLWNTNAKPEHLDTSWTSNTFLVDSSGKPVLLSELLVKNKNTYWDNSVTEVSPDVFYWVLIATQKAPAGAVGTMTMLGKYLRPDLKGAPAWSYIPGQRRVRVAPEFAYDGVSTSSAGILMYDEVNGFDGKMDRFDFKLVGRKELYIPYNTYVFNELPMDKVNMPNHWDPASIRFELHRVWMVEATLKPGERHVQKRKVFYVDEDSWNIVLFNGFDQADKLHHLLQFHLYQLYDKSEIRNSEFFLYDTTRRAYLHSNKQTGPGAAGVKELYGNIDVKPFPPNFFTPDSMAGQGIR